MKKQGKGRKILFYFSAILAGLIASGSWLYWTLALEGAKRQIANGPWFTSELYGAETADPFTRTTVALSGLFALAKEETIYYTAFTDRSGQLLRAKCDYVIKGRPLDARWWSITLYGADHFLVKNDIGRHAFNMKNLTMNEDGSFDIHISQKEKTLNWLPSSNETLAGSVFSLTLRLYNPGQSVYSNMRNTPLPRIERGDCT